MREYRKYRGRLLKDKDVRAGYAEQTAIASIGRLMRRIREQAELSQEQWAKLTGMSQADISRLEAGMGKKGPTFDTLVRWVHANRLKLVIQAVPKGGRDKAVKGGSRDREMQLGLII